MAVTVSLAVSPAEPAHGDTVTATYLVSGNDPVDPKSATVSGLATIGDQTYNVFTLVTLPGTAALPESFEVPVCEGLVFAATEDPKVFAAVVP